MKKLLITGGRGLGGGVISVMESIWLDVGSYGSNKNVSSQYHPPARGIVFVRIIKNLTKPLLHHSRNVRRVSLAPGASQPLFSRARNPTAPVPTPTATVKQTLPPTPNANPNHPTPRSAPLYIHLVLLLVCYVHLTVLLSQPPFPSCSLPCLSCYIIKNALLTLAVATATDVNRERDEARFLQGPLSSRGKPTPLPPRERPVHARVG